MNKNELAAAVSEATGMTKADASRAVDAVLDSVTGALKAGNDVRLAGFGSFSVSVRKAGEIRNPRTGEMQHVAASKQAKFKAAKGLKDALN